MIRAIFFDFYSVWTPDRFSYYLANAQLVGPEVHKQMFDLMEKYYQGQADINTVAETLRVRLGHPDITPEVFRLDESSIAPDIVDFIRELHAHFLKVGVFGNLGKQEYDLLNNYNEHNQLFELIASPYAFQMNTPLLTREVFVKALSGIGEPPENCLLVSGNPNFLAFAASLGINTYQFEGLDELKKTVGALLESEAA